MRIPSSLLGLLQWGRDIAVADRGFALGYRNELPHASMGPRHRCRGSSGTSWTALSDGLASMGPRHRCRGSTRCGRWHRRERHRFNGAATSLSRIEPSRYVSTTPPGLLQWGRDIAVADRTRAIRASSCPRSFNGAATSLSRIAPKAPARPLRRRQLQWGRDIAVADRLVRVH